MRILQITEMESISRADLMIARTDEFELLKFERRGLIEFEGTNDLDQAFTEAGLIGF